MASYGDKRTLRCARINNRCCWQHEHSNNKLWTKNFDTPSHREWNICAALYRCVLQPKKYLYAAGTPNSYGGYPIHSIHNSKQTHGTYICGKFV